MNQPNPGFLILLLSSLLCAYCAALDIAARYEVKAWKDTGTPVFRVVFVRCEKQFYTSYRTYFWYFKIMSFYSIWIAKFDQGSHGKGLTVVTERVE